MAPKTILVALTSEAGAVPLMQAATALARTHDAHLIGLHVVEALMVYPAVAMHFPTEVSTEFNSAQLDQAARIEEIFRHHTRNEDFPSEWRLVKTESTTATERIVESARAADLVIAAQAGRDRDRTGQARMLEALVRNCGRPLLVIPQAHDGSPIGASIVLGWSDTREAARAAHDLLEIAVSGAEVFMMRAEPQMDDELADHTGIDMAEAYHRHGISATLIHRETSGGKIAELLGKEALERGADMIVAGAFGHSRTYDIVIGAVSHDLLHLSDYPVLFSR